MVAEVWRSASSPRLVGTVELDTGQSANDIPRVILAGQRLGYKQEYTAAGYCDRMEDLQWVLVIIPFLP